MIMVNFNIILSYGAMLVGAVRGSPQRGFRGFTTYEPGSMNLIITCPHEGFMKPSVQSSGDPWPDRRTYGCNNTNGSCVWDHICKPPSHSCFAMSEYDFHTYSLSKDVADEIQNLVGVRPHAVYNNLSRKKMDANRKVREATFGIRDAIIAYNDYNNFILQAKSAILGPGLLLDVHGQAHSTTGGPWIELGYAVRGKHLNSGKFWKTLTSINNLGKKLCGSESNSNNPCFKDLIRGSKSLGHFLNLEGLRAVPSPNDPLPGSEIYFGGDFTVRTHGSKLGGNIDAIQLEFPWKIRELWPKDKQAVVAAILCYYKTNYDTSLTLPSSVVCSK